MLNRQISLVAVLASILLFITLVPQTAQAVDFSYSGELRAADPLFNRPDSAESLPPFAIPVHFNVQPFSITISSSVFMRVTAANFSPETPTDSVLALYQTSFNPASPLTNLIAFNDDENPGNQSSFSFSLDALTNYFLVTTTFFSEATGTFTTAINPANIASVVVVNPVPEAATVSMLVASLFGVGIVIYRRKNSHI